MTCDKDVCRGAVARLWRLPLLLALALCCFNLVDSGAVQADEAASASATSSAPTTLDQRLQGEVVAAEAGLGQTLQQLRQELRAAVASAERFPAELSQVIARDNVAEGDDWILDALLSGGVAILAGWLIAFAFEWTILRRRAKARSLPAADERNRFIFKRSLVWCASLVILVVVGLLVIEILDTGVDVRRRSASLLLLTFAGARTIIQVIGTLLTPAKPGDVAEERELTRLRRSLTRFVVVGTLVMLVDAWLSILDLSAECRNLGAILLSLVLVVMLSVLCISRRHVLSRIFGFSPERDDSATETAAPSWLAGAWWILALVYFIAAWLMRAVHVLLNQPGQEGLVTAPVFLLIAGRIVYAFAHIVIGRLVKRSPVLLRGGQSGARMPDFLDLAQRSAGLLIVLAALMLMAEIWGVSILGSGLGGALVKIAMICVVGYIFYEMVRIAIDRKRAREGGLPDIVSEDEDFTPLPPGESRLATLLPLARMVLLACIFVLVVMMVLSELGVNVAPLFASAGILGLAVGFGSQALVRDVFSGAFFLIDDAFRVGEYVDLGGGTKGTVERISIRSFQLRHQNGPLHTVPFGEIKQMTNLSRGWAITKLPFSFPHGTDVEKVRKVIKKVGQELLDDPVFGDKFLQPLKSQGVVHMDSTAMTFQVKFMTPPTVQSQVKRAVYARLSHAFINAGLEFANTTVQVRIEADPEHPLTEGQKHALAAGAASQVASDQS